MNYTNCVFVCSEFGGLESNLLLARQYCQYVLRDKVKKNNVFAPHLFFPTFLNESSKEDRALGIHLGLGWLEKCNEVWVFVRNGVLSEGMVKEIDYALNIGTPVFFFDTTEETIVELRHLSLSRGQSYPTKEQLLAPKPFAKKARTKLDDIADALKAGKRYEDLQDELESFLGPVDKTLQDPELDAKWELEYRKSKE
jgi:hypothetical protein